MEASNIRALAAQARDCGFNSCMVPTGIFQFSPLYPNFLCAALLLVDYIHWKETFMPSGNMVHTTERINVHHLVEL